MEHLSKTIKHYILLLKIGFEILVHPKKTTEIPVEVSEEVPVLPSKKFRKFSEFLRSSDSMQTPAIFSSNNSLKSCISYGGVNALINVATEMLEALMLDKRFDFEKWRAQRSPDLIRNMFFRSDGGFYDVYSVLYELRQVSLRLSESYELRRLHPEIGVHVYSNLAETEIILTDLENFFTELFHESRQSESGPEPHPHGRG